MKHLLILTLLVIAAVVAAGAALPRGRPEWDNDWKTFKGHHGKKYKDALEEGKRRANWEKSREVINKHNREAAAGLHTYKMAENHMSDLTVEERLRMAGSRVPASPLNRTQSIRNEIEDRALPASVDWRNSSCMPPVKDQKECGACWAFAGNTPLEFSLCQERGYLQTLSEQQLLDCTGPYGNSGCDGGFYTISWNYVSSKGQASSASYPYTGTEGTCRYTSSMSAGTAASFSYVDATVLAMRTALVNGPVSVLMDAQPSLWSYSSGVYSDASCSNDGYTANHAIAIVGYGTLNGINHWIIRNSWTSKWGIRGYAFIKRGVNMCNIESGYAAYPLV